MSPGNRVRSDHERVGFDVAAAVEHAISVAVGDPDLIDSGVVPWVAVWTYERRERSIGADVPRVNSQWLGGIGQPDVLREPPVVHEPSPTDIDNRDLKDGVAVRSIEFIAGRGDEPASNLEVPDGAAHSV